jgi:lysozyme family protein
MSALFDTCLRPVLWEEGVRWDAAGDVLATGLNDDPQDPGGLTNWGIALNAHPELTAEQLRVLDYAAAAAIYAAKYWAPVAGDDLPPALALVMLDGAVEHGDGEAVMLLQQAARFGGADVDGRLGPKTRLRVGAFRLPDLVADVMRLRLAHYQAQPNWAHDGVGWQRRLFRITLAAGALGS